MAKLTVQRSPQPLPPGTAACMGAFDGLHRGHQALLQRARAVGEHLALITFDPHPVQVLAPERAPRLLHTPTQRERIAESLGVDHLVLLPFDRAMAQLSPADFVRRYLLEGLRPSAVVVGEDFRFGAGRAGDAQQLRSRLAEAGVHTEIVAPVPGPAAEGGKLSSTTIRRAIDEGDVGLAAELLGRYHTVHGRVVPGAKRGRSIGFPTANVDYGGGYLPPLGVYATFTVVWDPDSPDHGKPWPSVTNVGHNPTFTQGEAPVTLETHVLDEQLGERLYGVEIEVAFVQRLRPELRFSGPEPLVEQIRTDVEDARAVLAKADRGRVLVPPSPLGSR